MFSKATPLAADTTLTDTPSIEIIPGCFNTAYNLSCSFHWVGCVLSSVLSINCQFNRDVDNQCNSQTLAIMLFREVSNKVTLLRIWWLSTYRVPTNWRRFESISKAIDPEVVSSQNNLLESLVIEEHVKGGGVRLLPRVVGLVLHAAIGLLLEAGIGLGCAQARDKVCASHKPENRYCHQTFWLSCSSSRMQI